jgi:hypothetical protein
MSPFLQKTPIESFNVLSKNPMSFLVDVRSKLELSNDGVADLSEIGREIIYSEWRLYPSMEINVEFFDEISQNLKNKVVQELFFYMSIWSKVFRSC